MLIYSPGTLVATGHIRVNIFMEMANKASDQGNMSMDKILWNCCGAKRMLFGCVPGNLPEKTLES